MKPAHCKKAHGCGGEGKGGPHLSNLNPELSLNLEKTAHGTKRKPTNKAALRRLPVFVRRITDGDAVALRHSQPENVNNSLSVHMLAAAARTRV